MEGDDRAQTAGDLGDRGLASFLSTVTTCGTAVELTAAELGIEAFLPADPHTADVLRELAAP